MTEIHFLNPNHFEYVCSQCMERAATIYIIEDEKQTTFCKGCYAKRGKND
jgi:predicted nucleic acid-binding Zn ribbon protein